jgi:hypothetical protein
MILKQTRLVTTDVAKLTRFYESISQSKAAVLSSGYADVAFGGGALVSGVERRGT